MAVLQMKKITICALLTDRKQVLDFLQGAGVVEISRLEEPEESDFQRPDTSARRQSCERDAWTAEQALEVLDQYAPEKTSLLSGLAGKPLASGEEFAAVQENCRLIMEDVKQILEYSRKIGESRAAAATGFPAVSRRRTPAGKIPENPTSAPCQVIRRLL